MGGHSSWSEGGPRLGRGLGTPSCPLPTSIQPNRAEMTESDSVGGRGRVFSLHTRAERGNWKTALPPVTAAS